MDGGCQFIEPFDSVLVCRFHYLWEYYILLYCIIQALEEILGKIAEARKQHSTAAERKAAAEAEEAEDIQRKVSSGYCFNCETWCHGACGHYSNDPHTMHRRRMAEATREANYGIND